MFSQVSSDKVGILSIMALYGCVSIVVDSVVVARVG